MPLMRTWQFVFSDGRRWFRGESRAQAKARAVAWLTLTWLRIGSHPDFSARSGRRRSRYPTHHPMSVLGERTYRWLSAAKRERFSLDGHQRTLQPRLIPIQKRRAK